MDLDDPKTSQPNRKPAARTDTADAAYPRCRVGVFTEAEVAYLNSQRLGRLATAVDGLPHVVPVVFQYNPDEDTIDIGGHSFAQRKKFRDVQTNPNVAFVVDDLASVQPWAPRGIEIRGEAVVHTTGGKDLRPRFDDEFFRIRPVRIFSWGLVDGAPPSARNVVR
jgi:pyridoxamine 5'-phosphate oxidase family protein